MKITLKRHRSLADNLNASRKQPAPKGKEDRPMESVVFEVVTKAAGIAVLIVAFIVWVNCGMPYPTINRKG